MKKDAVPAFLYFISPAKKPVPPADTKSDHKSDRKSEHQFYHKSEHELNTIHLSVENKRWFCYNKVYNKLADYKVPVGTLKKPKTPSPWPHGKKRRKPLWTENY